MLAIFALRSPSRKLIGSIDALSIVLAWQFVDLHIHFMAPQAVEMFLDEKIGYMDIVKTVEKCCDKHQQDLLQKPSLDEIVHYDQWARDWVSSNVGSRQAVAV